MAKSKANLTEYHKSLRKYMDGVYWIGFWLGVGVPAITFIMVALALNNGPKDHEYLPAIYWGAAALVSVMGIVASMVIFITKLRPPQLEPPEEVWPAFDKESEQESNAQAEVFSKVG